MLKNTTVAVILALSSLGQALGQPSSCDTTNGGFSLSIEQVAQDLGTYVVGDETIDLTGFSTYRLYLECETSTDKLSAVFGNASLPLFIHSTTDFYQSAILGGANGTLANGISPLLFGAFPDLAVDSWVTIGIDQMPNASIGETSVSLIEDPSNPLSDGFANGGNLTVDSEVGSTWFIDNSDLYTNGLAGADSKVLVAQLTTDGEITGQLGMQVFRNGISDEANCIRPYLGFQTHGCLEPSACNYAPNALFGDGSCDFCSCPDSVEIVSATFASDSLPQYALELDLIADHDTSGIPALAGTKTYRLYAKVDDPSTIVNAVFGNDEAPLAITTTTTFHQSPLGGATPNFNSPLLFDFPGYEDLPYDSWGTIGIDRSPSFMEGPGYEPINTVGDWVAPFEAGGGIFASDVVGGTWFAFPSSANVVPDEDLRILIGQFTTSGVLSGTLGLQVVPVAPPVGVVDYRLPFSFSAAELGTYEILLPEICTCENVDGDDLCDYEDPCISVSGACNDALGCTDSLAWNFDPAANIDDGSCVDNACGTEGVLIAAYSYSFSPSQVTIPVGGTVVWQAEGNSLYDVNGSISSITGAPFENPESFSVPATIGNINGNCMGSWTFDVPGIYHYDCSTGSFAELGMTGSITVGTSGCSDPDADNFSPDASYDFVFCEYLGCTDITACNYDSLANVDDGNCLIPSLPCEACEGELVLLFDSDGDGVCDGDEVLGCTNEEACNFLPLATEEDGSCLFTDAIGTCGGDCELDVDGNGVCDTDDVAHCGPGTHWDVDLGMCVITCPSDVNQDQAIGIGDLLLLLASFGSFCPVVD